jgi:hypothetical protein
VTIPSQSFIFPENGLGLGPQVVNRALILGVSSAGTANVRTTLSQPTAILDTFGEGAMPEAATRVLQIAGGPVDCIKTAATTAGAMSAVTKVAVGSSTGTITLAGAPYDAYNLIIEILQSGTLGAGTFRYSLDGRGLAIDDHKTWSEELTIPAGGAFIIPRTNVTATFVPGAGPAFFEDGDTHTALGTAPHYNLTDLANAMTAIKADPGDIVWILFTGQDVSAAAAATAFAAIASHLQDLENQHTYVRGIMDAGADTAANVAAAFAAVSDKRLTYCYGLVELPSSKAFTGWAAPSQLVTVALGQRVGRTLLSEDPGRVASGAITGATNPSHNEFVQRNLDSHKCTTVMTHPKRAGLFFTNAWLKSQIGSDYRYWQHGRIMDAACDVVYFQQGNFIASEPRTNADGTIFENDAKTWEEGMVTPALENVLTKPENRSGNAGHVSEFSYKIDRTVDLIGTETIESNFSVRPLGYPKTFVTTLGFAREV